MSQIKSKRKFLKPIEFTVAALLALSAPLPVDATTSFQDINTTPVAESIANQNATSSRELLLVEKSEKSNAEFSKVGHYSHSSHSSHSSHASHYSSSR